MVASTAGQSRRPPVRSIGADALPASIRAWASLLERPVESEDSDAQTRVASANVERDN